MKHIKINNIDYVIARLQKDRKAELVDHKGVIRYVDQSLIDPKEITYLERGMIPGSLNFTERAPSFIVELQRRRLAILHENVKARRKSQSGSAKSRPSKRVNAPLKGALDHVPPHLRDQIALAMNKRRK